MDVKDGTVKDNGDDNDNDDDDKDDGAHTLPIGNKYYVVTFLGHARARGRHDPCGGSPLLQPLRFRGQRRINQPTNRVFRCLGI